MQVAVPSLPMTSRGFEASAIHRSRPTAGASPSSWQRPRRSATSISRMSGSWVPMAVSSAASPPALRRTRFHDGRPTGAGLRSCPTVARRRSRSSMRCPRTAAKRGACQ